MPEVQGGRADSQVKVGRKLSGVTIEVGDRLCGKIVTDLRHGQITLDDGSVIIVQRRIHIIIYHSEQYLWQGLEKPQDGQAFNAEFRFVRQLRDALKVAYPSADIFFYGSDIDRCEITHGTEEDDIKIREIIDEVRLSKLWLESY